MTLAAALSLVIAAAAFVLAVALPSNDPDLFWHLASARWMVDHGSLLTHDPFSHSAAGAPYSVGEWLGELVWYAAFRLGAWQGIAVLRALLVGIAAYFTSRTTLLVQPRPIAAVVPVVAALAVSKTTWTDRPQLFTLALFAAFFFVLLRARRGGGTRALWTLPPLVLLWTNLHGGYAVGVALVALFFVAALVERLPHRRTLGIVLVACAVLSFADPAAIGLAGAAGHAASPPRFIAEELPPDVFTPAGAVFAALFLAALAAALVAGRAALVWPIVLAPLVWLGLSAQRHLPLAAIALAPYVAAAVPEAVARLWPRARLADVAPARAPRAFAIALVAALAVGAVAASALAAPASPDESRYPAAALGPLAATPGNLLNEYDWGGYLVWNAPEHPVFIDGRLFLYLPTVFDDYRAAVDLSPRYAAVLERYRVDVVLLRPSRPLAVFLREAGWRVRAETGDLVLLVRP